MAKEVKNKIEYETVDIIDIVRNSYKIYGEYVNFNRFIPNALDGLKPSYRKAIYATMKVAKDGLAGADSVLGEALHYYNHGSQYLVPVLCKLAKYGILRDDGANGAYFIYGENQDHAASRYLETGVNEFYYKLFSKLLPYVPYSLSDKGYNEPDYIPTPIPLGLTFGYNAVSCGSNTEIPPFTANSLFEAMINNSPDLLKMSFGLELVKGQSNLIGIWTKGAGKLTVKYPTEYYTLDGEDGILITGNPIYFKPAWGREIQGFDFTLDKLVEKNLVEVLELERDGEKKRTFIKIRNRNLVDLKRLMEYVNVVVTRYKLIKLSTYVTNPKTGKKVVTRLSLRSWLKLCYDNYIKLLTKYKSSNIDKLNKQKTILEWLPKVAQLILDSKGEITNQEICDKLKIESWIVEEIMKKTISNLKKKDTATQIESINKQIEQFLNFNPEEFTMNVITEIPE